jgi:glyoxylase-like metal-dependent hydrolase (beta-lactamase superfamily II)
MTGKPAIHAFFDEPTNTVSYMVADPATKQEAFIDPVLDYDPGASEVDTRSVDAMLRLANARGYTVVWTLETHAHADHLSGSPYVKAKTGAKIGIGEHIKDVQRIFRPVFDATDLKTDGSDFDHLFKDGERFKTGELDAEALYTPGHTPDDITYKIEDTAFVGDTLFMPDYGTARANFPGGDAHKLYRSIRNLMALPDTTRLFMCHDYKAPGRTVYAWETSVKDERENNVHVKEGVSEDTFVSMRQARDATLSAPRLLLPSIQVNIRAGKFPPAHVNGVSYLTIPVKSRMPQRRSAEEGRLWLCNSTTLANSPPRRPKPLACSPRSPTSIGWRSCARWSKASARSARSSRRWSSPNQRCRNISPSSAPPGSWRRGATRKPFIIASRAWRQAAS